MDPVRPSHVQGLMHRNRDLLLAATAELSQLEASLAGCGCRVLLTNGDGLIMHSTRVSGSTQQTTLDVACRLGVNLSEDRLGTTAPGIVLHTGQPTTVTAHEHYYDHFAGLYCAASPIRDRFDRLAGVLDVSTEHRSFGFDAASVVGMFATSIENRLLQSQSQQHVVVHFQTTPALLDTPLQGLAGLDSSGRVEWLNTVASRLLIRPRNPDMDCEELFGVALEDLLSRTCLDAPSLLPMPGGLCVWIRVKVQWLDGLMPGRGHALATKAEPAPVLAEPQRAPEPGLGGASPSEDGASGVSSLADNQQRLILATLERLGGNVARTARELGVSRGMIYRHLRKHPAGSEPDCALVEPQCQAE